MTFTATVTADSPGTGTPTGTVTFKDGSTDPGHRDARRQRDQASSAPRRWALAPTRSPPSIAATPTSAPSTSTALTQTVNPASTTTTLTSSANPSVYGQAVTFTATVTADSPGAGTPTGTVTFKEGSTILGTATLDASGQVTPTVHHLVAGRRQPLDHRCL